MKKDTIGNDNVLDARKYYCLEVYKNIKNETCLRGIRYVDLKKSDKKLWLTCDYPEGYKEHIMYLFALDYVKIYNTKGILKFAGYYRSIHNIKRANLWFTYNNNENRVPQTIGKTDVITKYNVDILGKIGGEIKCSEPFMLLKERE